MIIQRLVQAGAGALLLILAGLEEGEKIVASANFLIDSESSLKAALPGVRPLPGQGRILP